LNNKNYFVDLSRSIAVARCSATALMFRTAVAIVSLSILTACGGGKVITTVDNSADYKSAVSLPPLKKPSKEVATTKPQTAIAKDAKAREQIDDNSELVEDLSQSTDTSQAYVPNAAQAEPVTDKADVDVPAVTTVKRINAQVISPKSNVSRLQIEAEFDDAWGYLSRSLQRSDMTVFSRNKVAGRFAIGCSGIDTAPTLAKKGSWKFLNKRRNVQQEYCALQAVATRGVTVVTVLNRLSQEVDGESAGQVFSRVLNN